MTTIQRTVFTVEVLHRADDRPLNVAHAIEEMDTGSMCGTDYHTGTDQIPNQEVPGWLRKFGNDGHFFDAELEQGADDLEKALQKAANASLGDSNDKEIQYLQEALDEALNLLGRDMPEATEPDDEDEE